MIIRMKILSTKSDSKATVGNFLDHRMQGNSVACISLYKTGFYQVIDFIQI